jgi:hypothetical protein
MVIASSKATIQCSDRCKQQGAPLQDRSYALIAVLAVLACALSPASVDAHGWYPQRYCYDRACFRVDSMTRRNDGSTLVTAAGFTFVVPANFPVEGSLDEDAHICVRYDLDSQLYRPICFFRAPEA